MCVIWEKRLLTVLFTRKKPDIFDVGLGKWAEDKIIKFSLKRKQGKKKIGFAS